jgi:tRNA (adenine57-N1/adenine58-N1)-methyltransferase
VLPSGADESTVSSWKQNRKAVINTIDIDPNHSAHAQNIVRGFKHGLYHGNVDFHTGTLDTFFEKTDQLNGDREKRFLSHVVLDMPSTNEQMAIVASHMRDDAKLVVFNPSVTQIVDCVERVHEQQLPLKLERVVELAGSFSGGRDWDVRMANARKPDPLPTRSWFKRVMDAVMNRPALLEPPKHWVVCRPMAGERIVVGGFIGLWKRTSDKK